MAIPELIVALDLPRARDVEPLLRRLPAKVSFFKIGLELFTAAGPHVMDLLVARKCRVFLDLKLHDIPRTVANTVQAASRHGASLLTVHALGGRAMLAAAVEAAAAAGEAAPRLIAVTTLTSLKADDLAELGIGRTLAAQALALGELALASGMHGLVTSAHEARALRDKFGPQPILVTPGIRPAGADRGDQQRVATPAMAVAAGATCLVVGRPIVEAPDPGRAAEAILAEIAAAATAG